MFKLGLIRRHILTAGLCVLDLTALHGTVLALYSQHPCWTVVQVPLRYSWVHDNVGGRQPLTSARALHSFTSELSNTTSRMQRIVSGGAWKRIVLWVFWSLSLLVTVFYVIVNFYTCSKLISYAGNIDFWNTSDLTAQNLKNVTASLFQDSHKIWRAPISATMLGGIMVLIYIVLSFIILLRKQIKRAGPGFGYGFVVAWCFVMSWFTLICALILDSFNKQAQRYYSQESGWNQNAYVATYIVSYITAAMFMVFFVCMLLFQGGIEKRLGLAPTKKFTKSQTLEMNALNQGPEAS